MFVTDHPFAVDDKGLRHTIDAPIDADVSLTVYGDYVVGISKLAQPAPGIGRSILVIESHDPDDLPSGKIVQQRMLHTTGTAPRCPDIQQPDLAAHLGSADHPLHLQQSGQFKLRRGLIDQRRRHLSWIELQPERKENGDHDKNQQRR